MARTLSVIYDTRIPRNLFRWYVGEKQVGWDKKKQASKKKHVLSAPFSALNSTFCRLDPIAVASTFASSLAVFSFLFRFLELVHENFHGPDWFIPKRITPRKMGLCKTQNLPELSESRPGTPRNLPRNLEKKRK